MLITQLLFTLYLLWGEIFQCCPPLPYVYLWSSARAAHLIILMKMNSCLLKQLLPGNWITDEENSCYPNSLLPGNFGTRPKISLHVHHAYLNAAQNICVLFYSNPQGGCGGQFFLWMPCESGLAVICQNCFPFSGIFPASWAQNLADLLSFSSHILTFSLKLYYCKRVQYPVQKSCPVSNTGGADFPINTND